jgi:mono/diheme cytochrome c family protein
MHAPVSTFEHKGKQYVLAFSAGNTLIGSARGDSVWLFGLDGTLPPAPPAPTSRQTGGPPAATPAIAAATSPTPRIADADLARGRQLYQQACVVCHGEDGKGGHGVGAPLDGARDFAATIRTVTTGRNTMPSFSASFNADQIRDVSAYVVETLSAGRARR